MLERLRAKLFGHRSPSEEDHPLTAEERGEQEYDPRLMGRFGDARVEDLAPKSDPKKDPF
jgi:hypothetical protein